MLNTMNPIDDGILERGHVTTCDDCGCRGVYCDTSAGEIVDNEGRPIVVEMEDGLVPLLVGRIDGTETESVFCEDCCAAINLDD